MAGATKQPGKKQVPLHLTRALLNRLSDGILLADKNNQVLYANKGATTIAGIKLTGSHLKNLFDVPETPVYSPASILFQTKDQRDAIATFFDIKILPGLHRLAPRAKHAILLQLPVPAQTTPVTTSQLMLGHLTLRILHDFNNSLSSILGNAEFIEQTLDNLTTDNPALDEALTVTRDIIRKTLETAQTNKRLQDYAKQQPRSRDTLDLNETINNILPFGQQILSHKIKVDFLPSPNLPPLYADPTQLDQIILSLLINSKESMPQGGHITVTTSLTAIDQLYVDSHPGARPGEYLLLTLSDNGSAIPKEVLPEAFELFSSQTQSPQTALRLPTAYAIVKQLAGYIDVESWEGQGSRFDIYLPVYKNGAATTNNEQPASPPHPQRKTRPGRKTRRTLRKTNTTPPLILIAEDEQDVIRTFQTQLERAGYRTITATNGNTALEFFERSANQKDKPVLVISDLGLPGMDGKTLCKKIQEKYKRTEVVLISGHRIDLTPDQTKTDDGFFFLQKPFTASTLVSTVNRILNKKQQ